MILVNYLLIDLYFLVMLLFLQRVKSKIEFLNSQSILNTIICHPCLASRSIG
jgi:hypothetical protein